MSLTAYEDFDDAACLALDGDPVTAWQRQSEQARRLTDWVQGKEEVRIQAEGTDITLGVAGRNWIPCVGEHNMPDGEFFTGPVEDAVNGEIAFSFPASYGGRTVSGVRMRFEDGRVVDASAEQGEEFLLEMLDTDDGARRSASSASARTSASPRPRRRSCSREDRRDGPHGDRDELPRERRHDSSAVHWDMVCDLRNGGSITVDGEELQRDGKFLV